MNHLAAAFAAAVLATAPLAHAQTACEEIALINASGLDGFESIEGPVLDPDDPDEFYESEASLFGANDCLIDQMFEPVHACVWEFETEAQLMAAYETRAAAIATCLAGWERKGLLLSDPDEPGYRTLVGDGYLGADIYEELSWAVLAEYEPANAPRAWRLVIETTVYW